MKNLATLLVSACCWLAPASAQELGRLRPSRPFAVPGGQLEVQLVRGEGAGAPTRPWPTAEERNWIFLRAPGSQRNFAAVPTLGPEAKRAQLELPPGNYRSEGVVVGLDLRPTLVDVPLEDWQRFQVDRLGLEKPVPFSSAFDAPRSVRLRRIESMKLLLRLKEGKEIPVPSGVLMTKTGQAVELRPLGDPTTIAPGGDFPVKVYAPTGSTEGLLVTAVHEASGTRTRAITRPGGIAHLRISAAGAWTLQVHQLVRLGGTRGADFELRSASLSFVSPALEGELEPGEKRGKR